MHVKHHRTRRGYGNKNKNSKLVLLGSNAAGLKQKMECLQSKISKFTPGCIFIQETKLYKKGQIKLPNFVIFEQVRSNTKGGGLILAIQECFDPVLIHEGDDVVELLIAQGRINNHNIRFFNAYGPQEDEDRVLDFYVKLEEEIQLAKDNNCYILIEMDANAKLGYGVIKNDPNPQSKSGSLLWALVQRNNLVVVNSTDVCSGVITRHRVTKTNVEKAVLDYIIVCEELFRHVNEMVIDESRSDVLTKYASKTGRGKVVKSDHNLLTCTFDITYTASTKAPRLEVFNFKDEEGQKKFLEETSKECLNKCFTNPSQTVDESAHLFNKSLTKIAHKCFKKVRVTQKTDAVLEGKMKQLDELKQLSIKDPSNHTEQIDIIEQDIQQHCATENAMKIREQVKGLSTLDGGFSNSGLWKIKNTVVKKHRDPPMAKKDANGNLVTTPTSLKGLYNAEYIHRLRHREINQDLLTLKSLKDDLWERRFNILCQKKTPDWSTDQVQKIMSTLDTKKARDPLGYTNDIFKPGVCGTDLVNAITNLVNRTKNEMCTPQIMQVNNISTIYKNKGSRFDLVNDRGIFNMATFRKIVDRLIYNDKYEAIDENMSDSNVGARKGKNIRNHLFIVYGIINSVGNGESPPVDIQLYDIKQCFDAMWLEESMNNLCDTIPVVDWDDKLALVYENNRNNLVSVKTPFGLTDRVPISKIVTQGGVWGPIQCSNQIDTIGKDCVNRNIHLFTYKDTAKIMPLSMIDDILGFALCGMKSTMLNTYINSKIEMYKQYFSDPKCKQIHVGCPNPYCPNLQVHGTEFDKSTVEKYLGDFIKGTIEECNNKNVEYRKGKGIGITSQIMLILNSVSLGFYYFDIGVVLRESLLINGMLFNSEIWYGLTSSQLKELESVDKLLLRKLFDARFSTPTEALYLELGIVPLKYILQGRRLMFLHYLMNLDEDEMLYKFFSAQRNNPGRNDWIQTILQDINDLQLNMSIDEIKLCPRSKFKIIVREKCGTTAFKSLMVSKNSHSKLAQLSYSKLELQPYLKDGTLNCKDARLLFNFRTRMIDVGNNFKNSSKHSILCPLCRRACDDQEHLLLCTKIHDVNIPDVSYNDIFSTDTNKLKIVVTELKNSLKIRKKLLKPVICEPDDGHL